MMKREYLQLASLYPAKLSFRIEGHTKSFPDKKKLKKFITTKPVLHEILKGFLKKKKKDKNMTNKMAVNTYLSRVESKKHNKWTNRTQTDSWIQLPDRRGIGRMGEKGEGIKKYKSIVTE